MATPCAMFSSVARSSAASCPALAASFSFALLSAIETSSVTPCAWLRLSKPARHKSSRENLPAHRRDRVGARGVNAEHGGEAGDVEHLADRILHAAQGERAAGSLHFLDQDHDRPQP